MRRFTNRTFDPMSILQSFQMVKMYVIQPRNDLVRTVTTGEATARTGGTVSAITAFEALAFSLAFALSFATFKSASEATGCLFHFEHFYKDTHKL